MSNIKRIFYIIMAIISLFIGIIGIILPVIPAYIFFGITVFCLMRVSKRFSAWVKSTKIYNEHIKKYVDKFINWKNKKKGGLK
ncbi:MAG: DUF454 family protein [Clostridium chrysemydis]|uniref:DUF454 family protein n=1 Tax=Clostridium TaxID=1485 RepID=UPI00215377C5|nr:DUF454 family protein [Clostridium sp. LY3-2]MCR6515488.1 DUF454 family protein [Clostridium sp. LY3-2]